MFQASPVITSFSFKDKAATKDFYETALGLKVTEDWMGLHLKFDNGASVFMYPKEDHEPAKYTVLNFPVGDIDAAVDDLTAKGVVFVRYDSLPAVQDDNGVLRGKASNMGPDIAWFKDPSGNILSLMAQ